MTKLYANPCDVTANGFYFDSVSDYETQFKTRPWEEATIEYIDGDNPLLFKAAAIHQGNLDRWFDDLDHLDDDDDEAIAIRFLLDCGEDLDDAIQRADEVQVWRGTPEDYASDLVEEAYDLDSIPDLISNHIDYSSIVRDLQAESAITEMGSDIWVTNCLDF